MTILKFSLTLFAVVASLLLSMLVLMHRGRGGGLSDMFSTGLAANAANSGVAARNLDRWTVAAGLFWCALVVTLDLL